MPAVGFQTSVQSHGPFELLDLHGDGRLREMQLFGGLGFLVMVVLMNEPLPNPTPAPARPSRP